MLTLAVACSDELYGPEETPLTPDTAGSVEIAFSEVTDNSFKVTVTPSGNVSYYSYLVDASDAAVELDPETLYKVGYTSVAQGTVKYTSEAPSYTFTVEADPNATYQVYAVAGSAMGIPGEVATASIKTSDTVSPVLADFGEFEGADGETGVGLIFDEPVVRGTGDLVVKYYAMNSAEIADGVEVGQCTVPAENVVVDDNVVYVVAPELPAGAFYALDYPEGAFADVCGNKVAALTSKVYFGEATGYEPYYAGVGNRYPTVEWGFEGMPEGISDWTAPIVLTPTGDYPIGYAYREPFSLVYLEEGKGKATAFELVYGTDYGVSGGKVVVFLPEEPAKGATVALEVPAEAFEDYYGNMNEAWTAEAKSLYDMTVPFENVVGTYVMTEVSAFDGVAYPSKMVIEKSDNPVYGNVMFTTYGDIPCNVAPIYAVYDPAKGTLTMESQQVFATDGESYYAFISCTVSSSGSVGIGTAPVVFTVTGPNTIAGPNYYYGVLVLNSSLSPVSFYDVYYQCAAQLDTEASAPSSVAAPRFYALDSKVIK